MNRSHLVFAAIAVAAGCAAAPDVRAATAPGLQFQNASGFCQAALPVYEGNIRKRPTAVANEGTASAFVSCSMSSNLLVNNGVEAISLVLYNRNAVATEITCSMVNFFQAGGPVVPKTLSIAAGDRQFFNWTLAEVGAPLDHANFNCNLKPGTEIGYGYYYYEYEIGA